MASFNDWEIFLFAVKWSSLGMGSMKWNNENDIRLGQFESGQKLGT